MPETAVKTVSEREELEKRFYSRLAAIPGGVDIKMCIQCGTCAGSCPVIESMDHSPRELFALIKAGYLEKALKSNTPWQCISCYLCTVRCPAGIKITEVLYALRHLAIKEKLVPENYKPYILMKNFNTLSFVKV